MLPEGDVPVTGVPVSPSPGISRSHVMGSAVQLPEGQREASSAEHCPAQLIPLPHVTLVTELSRRQHVTVLVWLALVKTESKNSHASDALFVAFPGETNI